MGLSDKFKQLGDRAKEAAAEHKDQISQAVENAGVIADRRTRGKYSDKIAKATEKTGAYVERLAPEPVEEHDPSAPAAAPAAPPQSPPPGSAGPTQ
jgi:MT0933-like antitoxin protein